MVLGLREIETQLVLCIPRTRVCFYYLPYGIAHVRLICLNHNLIACLDVWLQKLQKAL